MIMPFKGWQAIPAAILLIYLLAGLFAPPEMPPRRFPVVPKTPASVSNPPLGRWPGGILGSDALGRDIFRSILFVSSRIERFAIPASVLGVVVGFAAAWVMSRMSPYARYAAYAVLVAVFAPAVVMAYSDGIGLRFYSIFSPLWNSSIGEYAGKILIPAVVSAVGTFLIIAFKHSRDSTIRTQQSSYDAADAASRSANPRATPIWWWVGVCFFVSLSLTILGDMAVSWDVRIRDRGRLSVFSLQGLCNPGAGRGRD